MLKIDLKNVEQAPDDWSEVFDYREDIEYLDKELEEFQNLKKVIVVGNGGSITSYDAYLGALGSSIQSDTVWTMEADYLNEVKKRSPIDETVVVAASKSGKTLGQIEALMAFADYKVICVTEPNKGPLSEIANRMGWKVLAHPPVGGRFSGGTSCAFVPALLAKMDVKGLKRGLIAGYELKNEAYSLSKYYFDLESKGYDEIYLPIYSNRLLGFQNLIVQLMHESVCKDGKGQTFYSFLGPEAQHHTNQRFLGGKKNVIGTFITVKNPENSLSIELPEKVRDVDYKGSKLELIDGLKYQDLLNAEYEGTKQDADKNGVPNITIKLDKITPESVGALVAFWHLVAFYSSNLRGVNPFDQPAVENSKNITLDIIKEQLKKPITNNQTNLNYQ